MTTRFLTRRLSIALSLCCLGLQSCQRLPVALTSTWPAVTLTAQDRLLILAPHPDDEVLCCGGLIQKAVAMGLPIRIAFLTYGDNNQWSFLIYRKHPVFAPHAMQRMGLIRRDEAITAANILGLSPDHLVFLGYPDFGTLNIWTDHWGEAKPFRSMLTHVTAVPYANARRPGTPYKGEELLQDVTETVREFRPTKIFVSHPGDHMPDHAALYLVTRVALWDLESELRPAMFPYLVHVGRWPSPRGFHPAHPLEPPARFREQVDWHMYQLGLGALGRKYRALQAHHTQYNASARYLLSFIKPNELFGDFPIVHLEASAPPVSLPSEPIREHGEIHEELTDEERARFIGIETRRLALEGDRLVLSVTYSRPLAEAVGLSVFVFGYRTDRPFAQMPKLHLQLGALFQHVLDQDRPLVNAGVEVVREPTRVTIRIPLKTLGNPQRLLTSARTYVGDVPLDWTAWRIVELPGQAESSAPSVPQHP